MPNLSVYVKNRIWRTPEGIIEHFSIPEMRVEERQISEMIYRMFKGGTEEACYFKFVGGNS